MGKVSVSWSVGSVVFVDFPFSDLSNSKLRPAVILAEAGRGDWILCQITSKPYNHPNIIQLDQTDFDSGALNRVSYARCGKLFTANDTLIQKLQGTLTQAAQTKIINRVVALLKAGK